MGNTIYFGCHDLKWNDDANNWQGDGYTAVYKAPLKKFVIKDSEGKFVKEFASDDPSLSFYLPDDPKQSITTFNNNGRDSKNKTIDYYRANICKKNEPAKPIAAKFTDAPDRTIKLSYEKKETPAPQKYQNIEVEINDETTKYTFEKYYFEKISDNQIKLHFFIKKENETVKEYSVALDIEESKINNLIFFILFNESGPIKFEKQYSDTLLDVNVVSSKSPGEELLEDADIKSKIAELREANPEKAEKLKNTILKVGSSTNKEKILGLVNKLLLLEDAEIKSKIAELRKADPEKATKLEKAILNVPSTNKERILALVQTLLKQTTKPPTESTESAESVGQRLLNDEQVKTEMAKLSRENCDKLTRAILKRANETNIERILAVILTIREKELQEEIQGIQRLADDFTQAVVNNKTYEEAKKAFDLWDNANKKLYGKDSYYKDILGEDLNKFWGNYLTTRDGPTGFLASLKSLETKVKTIPTPKEPDWKEIIKQNIERAKQKEEEFKQFVYDNGPAAIKNKDTTKLESIIKKMKERLKLWEECVSGNTKEYSDLGYDIVKEREIMNKGIIYYVAELAKLKKASITGPATPPREPNPPSVDSYTQLITDAKNKEEEFNNAVVTAEEQIETGNINEAETAIEQAQEKLVSWKTIISKGKMDEYTKLKYNVAAIELNMNSKIESLKDDLERTEERLVEEAKKDPKLNRKKVYGGDTIRELIEKINIKIPANPEDDKATRIKKYNTPKNLQNALFDSAIESGVNTLYIEYNQSLDLSSIITPEQLIDRVNEVKSRTKKAESAINTMIQKFKNKANAMTFDTSPLEKIILKAFNLPELCSNFATLNSVGEKASDFLNAADKQYGNERKKLISAIVLGKEKEFSIALKAFEKAFKNYKKIADSILFPDKNFTEDRAGQLRQELAMFKRMNITPSNAKPEGVVNPSFYIIFSMAELKNEELENEIKGSGFLGSTQITSLIVKHLVVFHPSIKNHHDIKDPKYIVVHDCCSSGTIEPSKDPCKFKNKPKPEEDKVIVEIVPILATNEEKAEFTKQKIMKAYEEMNSKVKKITHQSP